MSIQRPHTTPPPPLPAGFTRLNDVLRDTGLVRWLKITEARAALRALCAEQDESAITEREQYRQETLRRAKMEAER